ncbi:hypothetical protein ACOSQ3_009489 [Xanthoceras sorbifolium]
MEKSKAEEEIEKDIAAARQESVRHYMEECYRRGEESYRHGEVLEESLLTHEMEKSKAEEEIEKDIAAARQESVRHYMEECYRRGEESYRHGEGTSAGPSIARSLAMTTRSRDRKRY